VLGLVLMLLSGCALGHKHVEEALQGGNGTAARSNSAAEQYRVACPDVLDVQVTGRTDLNGRRTVGADGRIGLGELGRLRVEGQTPQEITDGVASAAGVPAARVRVTVAEFNSQHIYLFGEVAGQQRAVPYQGPETVADLLQRVGGITAGAAPSDVQIVRAHVIDAKQPEVFTVDLRAIVLDNQQKTNMRLQPFDQVYVGQTRSARWEKCVPPLLRPLYEVCWGLHRIHPNTAREPQEKGDTPAAPQRPTASPKGLQNEPGASATGQTRR
jgi:protein involved in polysaccharide export with SLBB domain